MLRIRNSHKIPWDLQETQNQKKLLAPEYFLFCDFRAELLNWNSFTSLFVKIQRIWIEFVWKIGLAQWPQCFKIISENISWQSVKACGFVHQNSIPFFTWTSRQANRLSRTTTGTRKVETFYKIPHTCVNITACIPQMLFGHAPPHTMQLQRNLDKVVAECILVVMFAISDCSISPLFYCTKITEWLCLPQARAECIAHQSLLSRKCPAKIGAQGLGELLARPFGSYQDAEPFRTLYTVPNDIEK